MTHRYVRALGGSAFGLGLLALGVMSALSVLVTTRHGVGIDADSVAYVDLARHLRSGAGFALSPGLTPIADPQVLRPTAHFPPLYSVLLASGETIGLNVWTLARWLGAVLAGTTAVLIGAVIRGAGASPGRTLLVVWLAIVSVDWLHVHAWALSEPLFLASVVTALGALTRCLRSQDPRWVGVAAVAASIAALTRYTGVAVLATGGLALALWGSRRRGRWRDVAVFLAIGGFPLVAWHVRGILVGAPGRPLGWHPITMEHLRQGLDTVASWLLPETIPLGPRVGVLALAVAGPVLLWRHVASASPAGTLTRVVATFACCYAALLVGTISFVYANVPLDYRLLSPLLVSAALVGWRLGNGARPGSGARRGALVAGIGLALIATIRATAWVVSADVDELGYASRVRRQSALAEVVRELPADVAVVSNAPDALYILTNRRTEFVPWRAHPYTRAPQSDYAASLRALDARLREQRAVLVYFRWLRWRWYLAPERELVQVLGLTPLLDAGPEGAVYVRAR